MQRRASDEKSEDVMSRRRAEQTSDDEPTGKDSRPTHHGASGRMKTNGDHEPGDNKPGDAMTNTL